MAVNINLIPEKANLKIYEGNSWKFSIKLDDTPENEPVVLTGSTIILQIRKKKGSPLIKELTLGEGLTIAGDDFNVIEVNTLCDFPAGRYLWELRTEFPDDEIQTQYQGPLTVKPSIIE